MLCQRRLHAGRPKLAGVWLAASREDEAGEAVDARRLKANQATAGPNLWCVLFGKQLVQQSFQQLIKSLRTVREQIGAFGCANRILHDEGLEHSPSWLP